MRSGIALLSLAAAFAQPPAFRAERILPSGAARPALLAPGMLVSIYGESLGPAAACIAPATGRPGYPTELCGVQVTFAGKPAGLLYVQERQINFEVPPFPVPEATQAPGSAEVRVTYSGASGSAAVRTGVETVTLSLEGPARIGGPLWIHLEFPILMRGYGESYPARLMPDYFPCAELEVRRNGVPLPRLAITYSGGVMSGDPCGHIMYPAPHPDRLPLHVQYRLREPGEYEVRYTRFRSPPYAPVKDNTLLQSAWTLIHILPAAAHRSLPPAPANAAELLSDYLPNLLAAPDAAALTAMLAAAYHPDTLVRQYAAYALAYWPESATAPRALALVQSRGPSDVLIDRVANAHPEILTSLAPYLLSDDPVLLRGAVLAVRRHSPALDAAAVGAAEHILRIADPQTANDFVAALGGSTDPRAAELLWSFVARHIHEEQAAIALTWRKDPRDLPRLAPLLETQTSLAYAFRNSYVEAGLPYLEAALAGSTNARLRNECARELIVARRPAGFAFAATAIEGNTTGRHELAQFVRDQFPELRDAAEAAVIAFLKLRAR